MCGSCKPFVDLGGYRYIHLLFVMFSLQQAQVCKHSAKGVVTKWKLVLYPNGDDLTQLESSSMFLKIEEGEARATFEISLLGDGISVLLYC